MKYPILFLCVVLCSCFTRPALMTRDSFDGVEIGTPIDQIQTEVGSPYAVHSKGGDAQEYEYIERIDLGSQTVLENHYFLIVREGRVVSKRMTQERSPAYDLIYSDDPNFAQ